MTLPPAGAPALTVPASSTTGSYTVNWTAVSAATTYQLQERVAGGSWSVVYNAGGTSSAISGKGYSTYDYQVRACNAGGCGAYSSVGSITVAPPPPPVPTGLKVTQSGYCRAIWNAASGATKYDLKINAGAIVYSGSSTAYVDDFGCATWYAVRACNAYTCSAWSPPAYKQGGGGTPLATQPTPEAVSATEGGE